MGRKFLKHVVIKLPHSKDNEINVLLSDVQNHVPYTGPHKRFLMHYGLCLETAGDTYFKLCFLICFGHTKF